MKKSPDLLLTALAPAIWGSSYITATTFLPDADPIMVSLLRALPAGLLLLLLTRQLPSGIWWLRVAILGFLNFSLFFICLFIAAYLLPGGIAAIVGAVQPLLVIVLAAAFLGAPVRLLQYFAALLGIVGVAMLMLSPSAELDPWGLLAGLLGAGSMACGIVLTRKWQPPVSALTFTAWQLTAGGVLLIPVVLISGAPLPPATADSLVGLVWLSLVGGVITYTLWFRGIGKLGAHIAAPLSFLSPTSAVLLGWAINGEALNALQLLGMAIVLFSVMLGSGQVSALRSWLKSRQILQAQPEGRP
ncbi:DMT family transporter [Roseibium sp.]|uniref:DMT family transporter n=1 Tax=Roseibium sp. TaxID=1936156 RepID=UPI003A98537A